MSARDALTDLLAGAAGGLAAVYAAQPLDTMKVKMQLFPQMYGNMFQCLATTVRKEGLRGLYAGTCPAIVSSCSDNSITFFAYGQGQRAIASLAGVDDTTRLTCLQNAAAGSIASIFTSMVITPMELVKIRMQASAEMVKDAEGAVVKRSAGEVIRSIWKAKGVSGFYRGLTATVMRECVGNALFFGAYEWAREWLKPAGGRKEDCTAMATATAAAAASVCSWLVIYPVDVVKSRAQMSDKWVGGLRLIRKEIRTGKLSALYSGLWPTLAKTVPACGAMLLTVEFSKPFIRRKLADLKAWWADDAPSAYGDMFSMCDFASGLLAGITSTCIGHPMDTVRTVQQVTEYNLTSTIRSIYEQDKFKGFFRGLLFPVLSAGVVNAVCFGVYGNTKRLINAFRNDSSVDGGVHEDVRFCCDAKVLKPFWHMDVFASGCVAGAFFTAINIPIEVVKMKLQLTNISPSTMEPEQELELRREKRVSKIVGSMKMTTKLYSTNGMRSLYRAGTLFTIRDVPSMGVYMLVYEHMCCVLKGLWNFGDDATTARQPQPMPKLIQIISGGLAGVSCWVCVLPFDVIKSKIIADDPAHPKYTGTWDCVIKMYRDGGVPNFFRGFWVLCMRAFIMNSITFVTYETLMKACNEYNQGTFVK